MNLKRAWANLNFIRSIPALMAYALSDRKGVITQDVEAWISFTNIKGLYTSKIGYLNWLLVNRKEFRNVFYKRIENIFITRFLNLFYPKLNSLYISTKDIGSGLLIMHGFSTIITAKSIGENCCINQQVTVVGYKNTPVPPSIGNNVRIGAGAIVIGDIMIGDNSIIGAGAVVTKSVPSGCVVVGNPAFIIKRKGVAVKEPL